MPWVPELFSAPALERFEEMTVPDRPGTVPFFAGLLAGEMDALIGSFSGEPELYLPVQGRVRGRRAFEQYVSEMSEWFERRNATVKPVDHDLMDAGEYRGRAGVERWLAEWEAAWADFGMDAEEVIEAGGGRVVAMVRMRATGRESAVTVERDDAILYEVPDGLIVRLDYFNDRSRALAAAGLSG